MPLNSLSSPLSSHAHPHPVAEIQALIDFVQAYLQILADGIDSGSFKPEHFTTSPLGESKGWNERDYADLYDVAESLCNEGAFHHALPIAVYLISHEPRDPRFWFLAGACLQRTGNLKQAAASYGMALQCGGDNAAAVYRIGECFDALGMAERAVEAFQTAADLCVGHPDLRDIHDWALNRLASSRSTSRRTHINEKPRNDVHASSDADV